MSDIPLELRPDYILGYAAGLAAGRLLPSIPQSEQEPVAYSSYGEDSGYVEHSTAAKAKASAQADIDAYRKEADQEWPDGIDFVCWGIVLQEARIVNEDDDSSTCDYALAPLITTHPAPQPAEVRAVSVPDGWVVARKGDGRIVVKSPSGDAWAWADEHSTGTSNDFVYSLLSAMLSAAPQATSVPDGLADQNVKSSAGLLLPGKVDLWVAERYSPAPKPSVPDEVLTIARDALDEIALAGMSGSGQESEDGMRDWHARQAWKFISIAAQAKCQIDAALAEKGKA